MEDVVWKAVPGYEELYEVSNTGHVKSVSKLKDGINGKYITKDIILKQKLKGNYYSVRLYKDNKPRLVLVHILIAMAFCPNPQNKPIVNHIDGDGENNFAINLEWVTYKKNANHAIRIGLTPKTSVSKEALQQLYINDKKSAKEISEVLKISKKIIYNRLREYKIEIRNASDAHKSYNITKDFLVEELSIKGKTHAQVAEIFGCSESLISQYAKKYNIKSNRK